MSAPTVRFRVDFGSRCSVGIGKIQLLEAIVDGGSLSQAARALRMSYRRAWLLLQDLNDGFDEPVAYASVQLRHACAHAGARTMAPGAANLRRQSVSRGRRNRPRGG